MKRRRQRRKKEERRMRSYLKLKESPSHLYRHVLTFLFMSVINSMGQFPVSLIIRLSPTTKVKTIKVTLS